MVTSPSGKGVIVMGGQSPRGSSKAMFELSASMEWTRLEQTLQLEHWSTLAIPIPDELVYSKDRQNKKKSRELSYLSQDNIISPSKKRHRTRK